MGKKKKDQEKKKKNWSSIGSVSRKKGRGKKTAKKSSVATSLEACSGQ